MSSSISISDKYAAAHANRNGPGDQRPTALDIIKDEGIEGQWNDKIVLITGASSGIGLETARAMHATGAHLYLPVRNIKKGEEVIKDILNQDQKKDKQGDIELLLLELDSFESIRKCAKEFLEKSKGKLNILILNAGVMATPEGKTKDGFETQFGTNHLGHFLLFLLLKDALLSSSTPQFNSRVVCLSSSAHGRSPILFDDYDLKKKGYELFTAYGQSKTANIYTATEIERRYGSQGIHANAVHPGGIFTGLQVHVPELVQQFKNDEQAKKRFKSTEQGAATTIWSAVSKEWEGKGGKYLEDCMIAKPREEPYSGYESWIYDQNAAERLWNESIKMVGYEE